MPDLPAFFRIALLAALLASACAPAEPPAGTSAPGHLRTEYLEAPLGIDVRQPRFSWINTGPERGWRQTAYRVLVARSEEALDADEGDAWDSGRVNSDRSIQVVYDGAPLASGARYVWKVRVWDEAGRPSAWSEPAPFSMGLLAESDWQADWIGMPPAELPVSPDTPPSPLLRKSFRIDGEVREAVLYATALGLYELRLNGERVGERVLAPEWTDYKTRIQYQTYDVTDLVQAGENALGAVLGDGWYAGRMGPIRWDEDFPRRGFYGPDRRLRLRLVVTRADGGRDVVASDGSWKIWGDGPIRSADNFLGETYDARLEQPGWDQPGFDDASWNPVTVGQPPAAGLVAQMNEPIRIVRDVDPVAITEPDSGVYIFDLGQNIAGWVRVRLDGPAGTRVQLRHGEMLELDGSLYTENLARAVQTDAYVLDGQGPRMFEPHFTYHGFRYVEVTGLPEPPTLDLLTGRVVASDVPQAGAFESSSPLLNQLFSNIVWSQRGNMHSVPTDCPQRDERMGWMGDVLVFAQTSMYNMDMAAFYTKFVRDIRDAQMPDGRYPDFAPNPFHPGPRFYDAAGWADAGVFLPWDVYRNYADTRLLEEHYDSMVRYVENIRVRNPGGLWEDQSGNRYSDWLNGDTIIGAGYPETGGAIPYTVFATAFYARSTQLLAQIAGVLGRTEDARRYEQLAADIRAAFADAFIRPDGRIEGETQAGYAMALHFGLVPDSLENRTAEHLYAAFEPYGGRLSTGFHSTVPMMKQLVRWGHLGRAYELLESTDLPSWGYSIAQGATTTWERWDGFVAGRGFQSAGMNSFNHYAFGSIGEWMYRHILGIHPDAPGFTRAVIAPRPGGSLTHARGHHDSIHGRYAVDWRIEGPSTGSGGAGRIELTVEVPPNTTARVRVPTSDPSGVTEGGRPAAGAEGVSALEPEPGAAVFEVGGGTYTFRAPY